LLPEIEKHVLVYGVDSRLYYTLDAGSFKPCDDARVRWLQKGDESAVAKFSREEGVSAGIARFYFALQLAGNPYACAAVFDKDEISSFSCIGMKTENVWSVKWVCTRASHRLRGEGKSVASACTARMLELGKSPLYSLRENNAGSRRLCESLGYRLVSVMTNVLLARRDS
jgi:hypothetical protein